MTDLKTNFKNLYYMVSILKENDSFILFNGCVKMNEETKGHLLKEYEINNFVGLMKFNCTKVFGVDVVIDENIPTDTFQVVFNNNIEVGV